MVLRHKTCFFLSVKLKNWKIKLESKTQTYVYLESQYIWDRWNIKAIKRKVSQFYFFVIEIKQFFRKTISEYQKKLERLL